MKNLDILTLDLMLFLPHQGIISEDFIDTYKDNKPYYSQAIKQPNKQEFITFLISLQILEVYETIQPYSHFKPYRGVNVLKVLDYNVIDLCDSTFIMQLTFVLVGVEDLKSMQSPRLVKTHLPVQLLPSSFWKNNCKVANFKEKKILICVVISFTNYAKIKVRDCNP